MTSRLRIAALASLLLHAAALGAGLAFLRHRAPAADPDKHASIELLMVEQKGSGPPTPGAPPAPPPPPVAAAPPVPEAPKTPPVPAQDAAAQPQPPQPQLPATPESSDPPPIPPTHPAATASAQVAAAQPPPAPPPPPKAPPKAPLEFNLGGTDSESSAMVSGHDVIPASIDDKARNRPPIYPPEAARRGQQGEVVLIIHVGANGLPLGTDVLETSGAASLDESAQDAVMRWRFIPAMKDGVPVPLDMQMRFDFTLN
jgi:protein TonB